MNATAAPKIALVTGGSRGIGKAIVPPLRDVFRLLGQAAEHLGEGGRIIALSSSVISPATVSVSTLLVVSNGTTCFFLASVFEVSHAD